ncbi:MULTISPECIES: hypothetical protein [Rhodobacterales]|jgi:hypothetical protein|uniref:hypothetical protein n=1 Tax=Rhodobacterales TaxID=204455 RepID=UPI00201E958E|nr:hypothetical protein [Marivivens sp.]MCL7405048.1 hypothetical protein [Marivivens geojensis]NBQ50530.1 hypothetical protein [Marivivens sp.]
MSTIVVRASDTALAMDEVVKRLGQDAYILSTKQKNGQVEIRATTEAPKPRRAPRFDVSNKTFGEVLAERTAQVQPAPLSVPEPVVVSTPTPTTHQPAFRPDPTRAMGGWPGLAPGFVADLWVELGQDADEVRGFFSQLCAAILPSQPMGYAPRTLIVGPKGSGKTLTAARLAAMMMTEQSMRSVRLIAPRKERLMAADALSGHVRLMGLTVERPLHSEIRINPDWMRVDATLPQVFDLTDTTPDHAKALVVEGHTEVILCLPSGLHPALIARYLSDWRDLSPVVCLTRTDDWQPMPEELSAIAASGLRLGLVGTGSALLDTLARPTASDLRSFATGWLNPNGART